MSAINLSMLSRFKPVLLTASVFMVLSCQSQQPANKKAEMDELLKRELANQEKAKSGNKDPRIEVITDANEVQKLRAAIIKKNEEKKKKEAADKTKNKTLWERYKENDKTVVPAMLAILKGTDAKKRADLYYGLGANYDDEKPLSITEPELVDQLWAGMNNPADEEEVVQLAGLNRLPGFEKKFEQRLLSGKSTDEGRIFFWLCHEGKNKPALDYIDTRIRTGKLAGKKLDAALSGLEYFGENGDEQDQKKIGDLAFFIYNNKLIDNDRYEDLKNSSYTSDAAETVLTCLFNYGDNRAIPIAKDILKRKIRVVGPVKALIRLEGSQHLDKVYALLRDKDKFYTGLDLVETIDRKQVSNDMLKEVMVQFLKQEDIDDALIDRIVQTYISLKAESYLKDPSGIVRDKQLAARITEAYERSQLPLGKVIDDMLALKLITKKPDESVIEKVKTDAEGNLAWFIHGILEKENVYHWFDAETGFVPADYDKLLLERAGKSKGVLKDIIVWMDAKENKDGETFTYTITVLSNNKAFIARPEDVGDWYDVPTVNAMLEKLLADLNSKEKFVVLDSGDQTVHYIFGDPEKIKQLIDKYNL